MTTMEIFPNINWIQTMYVGEFLLSDVFGMSCDLWVPPPSPHKLFNHFFRIRAFLSHQRQEMYTILHTVLYTFIKL